MASTLLPTPSFNPNIPIVSPSGGKKVSYLDPNSPEALLKKITTLQVQAAVDTKYDVAVSPYYEEQFANPVSSPDTIQTLLVFIICIFIALVTYKSFKVSAKLFLLFLAVLLVLLVIHVYVRNTNGK
uniref:Uncharacterized protein n=1 Tax=viral metagenome TaxID=1070528 RepID=A0A6C0KL83_9ZZZZ